MTYADLTDDQLTQIHRLAHKLRSSSEEYVLVTRHAHGIVVASSYYETNFMPNGDIHCAIEYDGAQDISNLWPIINQLREWGVSY
ncbi:hypothetical protein DYU11_20135 [Fibrisoma montanum]|uniref:Uncharacterized protein n=1 Tax=Fibrisoma montanum TaxID=2305895 RepID=A0A418M3Y7_9BACT|nr:hypothetical protein [Fibrisoma montanum]RIV20363.1 hypothetical protein DYU11_20135 [Fibrisoma montanum]